jgi:hypothetical protein
MLKNKYGAYLYGVYFSDGCVNEQRPGYFLFILRVRDEDFARFVRQCIPDKTAFWEENGTWNVQWARNQEEIRRLRESTENKTLIPSWIREEKEYSRYFIAGCMDGGGHFTISAPKTRRIVNFNIGFHGTFETARAVRNFMQEFGIQCGKLRQEGKTRGYMFNINPKDFLEADIPLQIERKRVKVKMMEHLYYLANLNHKGRIEYLSRLNEHMLGGESPRCALNLRATAREREKSLSS